MGPEVSNNTGGIPEVSTKPDTAKIRFWIAQKLISNILQLQHIIPVSRKKTDNEKKKINIIGN